MGRGFKVYHNLNPGGQLGIGPSGEEQPYSIVLEQRGKSDVLLLECIHDNYVVVTLGKSCKTYSRKHISHLYFIKVPRAFVLCPFSTLFSLGKAIFFQFPDKLMIVNIKACLFTEKSKLYHY